jgi:DNA-binding transcriptional LysR family regulator
MGRATAKALADVTPGGAAIHLPGLLAFECVARHLNFGRAAAELEVTPTAISKTVKQLESQLGVRLFNRTTRSVALSESGAQLLSTLGPALEQIRHSVKSVSGSFGQPYGVLRINTSFVAYSALIENHLPAFLARYPQIIVDVSVDNRLTDIVAAGFDAGIRLGHALHRDMVSVPLGPMQRVVVVGSPVYLAANPTPQRPQDLLNHNCIRQRFAGTGRFFQWEFQVQKETVTLDVSGRLIFDEMRSVLDAARRGCGLAYVFQHFAASELRSGQLVPLLEKFSRADETFHLYYPARTMMPGKLRAFLEFMRAANWSEPR